jgi:hypothetical protein
LKGKPLITDADVFIEYMQQDVSPDEHDFDKLNVLTLVYSRDGEAVFPIRLIVFEDGSVLSF